MARRDNREYRTYLRAEQRRQRGCIARRMQRHLHRGLLGLRKQVGVVAARTASRPPPGAEQATKNERPATNREPFACNFDRKDRHTRAARPIESRKLTARIHLQSRCRAKHGSRQFMNVRHKAVRM
jgi:hypothetical protein